MEPSKCKILIVGASIAGLTAAATLLKTGHTQVFVFERSSMTDLGRLPKNGGGIGLEDKSVHILNKLSISTQDFIIPMEFQEDCDRNGRIIRKGSIPFYSVYWGDLHAALLKKVSEYEGNEPVVHYDKNVVNLDESECGVSLKFSDGSEVHGDVVIGGDGIISCVRAFMFPKDLLVRHAGYYAWRGLTRYEDLSESLTTAVESAFHRNTLSFEISEGSHAVVYYLKQGINWVIYVNSDLAATPSYHPWNQVNRNITKNATDKEVNEFFEKITKLYRPALVELIRASKSPFINEMYDRDVIPTYSTERCVLIGDSAHPTTPHFIRGSNMAVQDGWALGNAFSKKNSSNFENIFHIFEKERLEYCNSIVLLARRMGRYKQGVLSPQQSPSWAETCTCDEFNDVMADGIPTVKIE